MIRLILYPIVLPIIILGLSACSLGGGTAPVDHFYRLPDISSGIKKHSTQALFKEIVIKPVKTTGLYHERAILFIESEKPLELQRYHYRFWASTPAELVHDALLQGVKSSGIATQVTSVVSVARPDMIIDSRIIHFERKVAKSGVEVLVTLDVSARKGKSNELLWNKRYSNTQALQTTDMHASARAFGEALTAIINQMLSDVSTGNGEIL